MEARFAERVVVVTGGGQGIGREIALRFSREGARVVLGGRTGSSLFAVSKEIEEAGGRVLAVPTDVGDEASVASLRDAALEFGGQIDVLVANAGIAGPTAVLWEQRLEDWEDVFRTNVTGTFLCCKEMMEPLIASKGNIVLIGSRTGKAALYGRTPYAASKLALVGIMRTLVFECGPKGVRVNLVSPGAVSGERVERVIAAQAEARGIPPEAMREAALKQAPLERFVEASEVADAALFLASDSAGSIDGEDLNVTAGLPAY